MGVVHLNTNPLEKSVPSPLSQGMTFTKTHLKVELGTGDLVMVGCFPILLILSLLVCSSLAAFA